MLLTKRYYTFAYTPQPNETMEIRENLQNPHRKKQKYDLALRVSNCLWSEVQACNAAQMRIQCIVKSKVV